MKSLPILLQFHLVGILHHKDLQIREVPIRAQDQDLHPQALVLLYNLVHQVKVHLTSKVHPDMEVYHPHQDKGHHHLDKVHLK